MLGDLLKGGLNITPETAMPMLKGYMTKAGYKTMAFIIGEDGEVINKNYAVSLIEFIETMKEKEVIFRRELELIKSDAQSKIAELELIIEDQKNLIEEIRSLNH